MSGPVDVLAVLDGAVEGYEAALPRLRGKQRDECEDGLSDLKEARAAFAELIEASSRVASHGTRSARQINADWDRLRAALTRVKCGAA